MRAASNQADFCIETSFLHVDSVNNVDKHNLNVNNFIT